MEKNIYKNFSILKYGDFTVKNQTLEYYATDTKKLAQKNKITKKISYDFNTYGFRNEEFLNNYNALALGCSVTLGEGLDISNTWPQILSEKLNMSIANLGVSGASCETCYRLAEYWIPMLKPKIIFWLIPSKHRIEIYESSHSKPKTVMPNIYHGYQKYYKQWIAGDVNADLKTNQSIRAIECLCLKNNINLYTINREDIEYLDLARDLMHPGPNTQKLISDKFFNKYESDE